MKKTIIRNIAKSILFILILNLNSCFFLFDESYTGIATTSLAGHISISPNKCYVPSDPSSDEQEYFLSFVFNLETVGDRYISLCLIEDNIDYVYNTIVGLAGNPYDWILSGSGFIEINIAFYASDEPASPGSTTVGDASEVLLFGITYTNNYQIAEFDIINRSNITCSNHLGYNDIAGEFFADLDLNVLHKKKYIVARVPLCGNFPIGTAANPLYSEKNLDE